MCIYLIKFYICKFINEHIIMFEHNSTIIKLKSRFKIDLFIKKINKHKQVLLKEVDLFANHWKIQVNGLTLMRQIGPNFSKVG